MEEKKIIKLKCLSHNFELSINKILIKTLSILNIQNINFHLIKYLHYKEKFQYYLDSGAKKINRSIRLTGHHLQLAIQNKHPEHQLPTWKSKPSTM
jgi:hypothetical protein